MEYYIEFISVVVILLLYIYIQYYTPSNLPPGPRGYPIVGNLFHTKPRTYIAFTRMKKQFGDIIYLKMGQRPCVVLTSFTACKEVMATRGDNFSGRAKVKLFEQLNRGKGLSMVDGPLWQEHRRFSLQVLRDFGFGRKLSEDAIINEAGRLLTYIDSYKGQPIDTLNVLLRTVANVIATITLSEQPGYDDEVFADMLISKVRFNLRKQPFVQFFFGFPWINKIPFFVNCLPVVKLLKQQSDNAHNYIKKKIECHRQNFDPEGEPRDFMDAYLQKQYKLDKMSENHSFCNWQLIRLILELFLAGTDTTANTIAWALLIMAIYPKVLTKVQTEIDIVIGHEVSIEFKHKKELPYVQAVMDEVQRFVSIAPNCLLHRNHKDDTVFGYHVPADTVIIPCLYAVMHDSNIWERPNEFYPEHFLTTNGEYRTREELIPFSIGRRACIGESLAHREYFLIFVTLVRHYDIKLEEIYKTKIEEILLGSDGIVRAPGDHKLQFKLRE